MFFKVGLGLKGSLTSTLAFPTWRSTGLAEICVGATDEGSFAQVNRLDVDFQIVSARKNTLAVGLAASMTYRRGVFFLAQVRM